MQIYANYLRSNVICKPYQFSSVQFSCSALPFQTLGAWPRRTGGRFANPISCSAKVAQTTMTNPMLMWASLATGGPNRAQEVPGGAPTNPMLMWALLAPGGAPTNPMLMWAWLARGAPNRAREAPGGPGTNPGAGLV